MRAILTLGGVRLHMCWAAASGGQESRKSAAGRFATMSRLMSLELRFTFCGPPIGSIPSYLLPKPRCTRYLMDGKSNEVSAPGAATEKHEAPAAPSFKKPAFKKPAFKKRVPAGGGSKGMSVQVFVDVFVNAVMLDTLRRGQLPFLLLGLLFTCK